MFHAKETVFPTRDRQLPTQDCDYLLEPQGAPGRARSHKSKREDF